MRGCCSSSMPSGLAMRGARATPPVEVSPSMRWTGLMTSVDRCPSWRCMTGPLMTPASRSQSKSKTGCDRGGGRVKGQDASLVIGQHSAAHSTHSHTCTRTRTFFGPATGDVTTGPNNTKRNTRGEVVSKGSTMNCHTERTARPPHLDPQDPLDPRHCRRCRRRWWPPCPGRVPFGGHCSRTWRCGSRESSTGAHIPGLHAGEYIALARCCYDQTTRTVS